MNAGASRVVLAAVNAAIAVEALRELHRICLAMDADRQDERPIEADYQFAMSAAEEALRAYPATERVSI